MRGFVESLNLFHSFKIFLNLFNDIQFWDEITLQLDIQFLLKKYMPQHNIKLYFWSIFLKNKVIVIFEESFLLDINDNNSNNLLFAKIINV